MLSGLSLVRKFLLLLGAFFATAAVSLGAAFVFGEYLQRELIEPYRSTTQSLGALDALESHLRSNATGLPALRSLRPETLDELLLQGQARAEVPQDAALSPGPPLPGSASPSEAEPADVADAGGEEARRRFAQVTVSRTGFDGDGGGLELWAQRRDDVPLILEEFERTIEAVRRVARRDQKVSDSIVRTLELRTGEAAAAVARVPLAAAAIGGGAGSAADVGRAIGRADATDAEAELALADAARVDAATLDSDWRSLGDQAGAVMFERLKVVAAAELQRAVTLVTRARALVLVGAQAELNFGDQMRAVHRTVLVAAFVVSGLYVALGVFLVKRWVVGPILKLRRATIEIARGNFSHRMNPDTRDELGELARDVNNMAKTLDAMQQAAVERERLAATGEMVRRLAHNIRNPLAGIRGLAEISRRGAAGHPVIQQNQTEIIEAVDRFNTWLGELLRANAPTRLHAAPGSVAVWLSELVEAHRPLARMRSVDLVTDLQRAPETATFDAVQLGHAIVAILTNAIQASPENSRVSVRAQPGASGDEWEVWIIDQGHGMTPEVREKVFRPYFTTKRDGNGIGLALAMQVAKAHGGGISVESAAGKGSTFVVRIPFALGGLQPPVESSRTVESSQHGVARGQHSGN